MSFINQQDERGTDINQSVKWLQAPNFSIVFVLLSIMLLVTACQPAKTPITEIDNNESTIVEPNIPKTNIVEPNLPIVPEIPVTIEPPVTITYEPNTIAPAAEPIPEPTPEPEPDIPEPNIPEPNIAEPNISEPNTTDSNNVDNVTKVTFHDKCAGILSAVVDKNGMVHYRKAKLKGELLEKILDDFASLDRKVYEEWPTNDKIAFWINAYNMQMLKIIKDNYPIKGSRWSLRFWSPSSIRHIDPTNVLRVSKWNKYFFLVMGEQFTLEDIEETFFRKQFKDPRVFMALTHATLSGPPLANKPYYGETLSEQLDEQVRKFLTSPRAFRIDRQKKNLQISALLEERWYGKDFLAKYGLDTKFKQRKPSVRAVLNFLTKYIPPADIRFLERENYTLGYISYHWRVNDRYTKP
jgi:hypothetical protein